MRPQTGFASALLLAAALLRPAAGVGCPSISGITLAGASGASEPALLAGLDFPATVAYSWVDSVNGVAHCSTPDDAKDLSLFDITVEGATMKSINYGGEDNGTQLVIDVEFPEGRVDTFLSVTFTDPSGVCNTTALSIDRYVYEKNVPLVPLLAVFVLCPLTRDVYFSLGVSGILGWMILERNPWLGFLRYFDTGLPDQIAGGFRHIMLFLFMMGGIVGATIKVGGVQGLGDQVVKVIKDSFLAQAAVYVLGWVIFLDDYATTVIVATTLRMITDKMRVSREKLAFLVDCTASPIAGLMPISTWIAHELFVLETALTNAGFDDQPYTILLSSIPKRFYSWFMLTFVAANFIIGRDWAFMFWVEKKAREEGIPGSEEKEQKEGVEGQPDEQDSQGIADAEFALKPKPGIPARWYNAFLPYFLLIALFVVMLFYSGATGNDGLYEGAGWDAPVKDIVGNADSWAVLKWVAGLVLTFQVLILYPIQYSKEWGGCIMWPRETVMAAIDGSKEYFGGALALMLAFTFAETMKDLQIDQYLVQMLGDSLSSAELPALTFILCAIFSLATGTSWGTMLVFMPTCVLLSKAVGGLDDTDLLTSVVASVLGGAVWGDHCSPVSDTTILSAAASSCPLLAHTITQLPYALFIGIYAILMGFLPTGGGAPAGLMIVIGLILIPLMHFGLSMIPNFGGPVPIYNPDLKSVTGQGCFGAYQSIKSLATGGKSLRNVQVDEADS